MVGQRLLHLHRRDALALGLRCNTVRAAGGMQGRGGWQAAASGESGGRRRHCCGGGGGTAAAQRRRLPTFMNDDDGSPMRSQLPEAMGLSVAAPSPSSSNSLYFRELDPAFSTSTLLRAAAAMVLNDYKSQKRAEHRLNDLRLLEQEYATEEPCTLEN